MITCSHPPTHLQSLGGFFRCRQCGQEASARSFALDREILATDLQRRQRRLDGSPADPSSLSLVRRRLRLAARPPASFPSNTGPTAAQPEPPAGPYDHTTRVIRRGFTI